MRLPSGLIATLSTVPAGTVNGAPVGCGLDLQHHRNAVVADRDKTAAARAQRCGTAPGSGIGDGAEGPGHHRLQQPGVRRVRPQPVRREQLQHGAHVTARARTGEQHLALGHQTQGCRITVTRIGLLAGGRGEDEAGDRRRGNQHRDRQDHGENPRSSAEHSGVRLRDA